MTDHELEQRLRRWYRAQVPDDETAPAILRSAIDGLAQVEPLSEQGLWSGRRSPLLNRLVPLGIAAATVVAVLVVGVALLGERPSLVGGPTSSPHPTGAAVSPSIEPAPAGSWRPTGPMTGRRWDHEAVLLADGSVLVVGGVGLDGEEAATLASAEVYEPDTDSWMPTGSLATSRRGHTLTRLKDGRVLAVGGATDPTTRITDEPRRALASAEVYDPASGTWEDTGQMTSVRVGHVAVLLDDGSVLVTGGSDSLEIASAPSGKVASAELYDPGTGSWTQVASMSAARADHGAALLADGTILVVGGAGTPSDPARSSAELYDAATGRWRPAGSMSTARHSPTATVLPDGRVLVTGNMQPAEIYDPVDGSWSPAPGEPGFCWDSDAILLPNGKVLDTCSQTQLYDPATGTWSGDGSRTTSRVNHTATLLTDGRVLVAGGNYEIDDEGESGDAASLTLSAEIFEPDSGVYEP